MLDNSPKLKKLLLYLMIHPYSARTRWWFRVFAYPFFIKKGKGAIIRSKARLDLLPSKKLELGYRTIIEDYTVINNGSGDIIIGDRVRVGVGSVLIGPVQMGSGSGLGQHVFIAGFNHGYKDGTKNSSGQKLDIRPTIIEEEAHVGANSVVVAGVTIGKRSQVGAGSVVTKDIPPFSIAVGNPAEIIKRYNHENGEWEKV